MRFATVRTDRGERLHVLGADGYVDLADATGDERLASLLGLAEGGGGALGAAREAAKGAGVPVERGRLGPAVPRPSRVLCLGVNYAEHAIEGGRAVPKWPESFVRGAGSVIGAVRRPRQAGAERAIRLRGGARHHHRQGRALHPAADAFDAILGYAVMNDGSAREWQRIATQWTPGKNFEGTMPIGPEVVTVDEVDVTRPRDPLDAQRHGDAGRAHVEMIVSVAQAVEYFSGFTTLRPGDVIATGHARRGGLRAHAAGVADARRH